MPNRAAEWRVKIATEYGGERPVVERARNGLSVILPDRQIRMMRAAGWVHTADGQEIDTDLEDAPEPGWHSRTKRTDYDLRIGQGANRRITPRRSHPTEYVEVGVPQWDNGGWANIPFTSFGRDGDQLTVEGPGYSAVVKALPERILTLITWDTQDYPFRFPLTLNGLTFTDGVLYSQADGEPVLWLGVSRWKDANGDTGEFDGVWDGTYLTYAPDLSGATFPVTVDPDFISMSTDMGYATSVGAFQADQSPQVGDTGGVDYHAWMRFPNVLIPQDATVSAASLWLYSNFARSILTNIYGIDEDNHAAPFNYTGWNTDHSTHTTASVAWDVTVSASTWTETPGIASIVNEIVGRTGWSSGNAIGIHIDDDGSSELASFGFATSAAYAPLLEITYSTVDWPSVRSVSVGACGTSGTEYTITAPPMVEDGDILLVVIGADGSDTFTAYGSWNLIYSETEGKDASGCAAWIEADGTEDGTTLTPVTSTDNSESAYFICYAIANGDVTTNTPSGTATNGDSAAPDPPSHTPSGGSGKILWIAHAGSDSNDVITHYPDSSPGECPYYQATTGGAAAGDAQVAAAAAFYEGTSFNPDWFTIDSGDSAEEWIAGTISVYPAAAVNTDRAAQVSWAEFEIPNAPRAAEVSWAEFEIPNAARAAQVSWAEFEIPTAARNAQVSWVEFEIPTAPRNAQVSWAELEIPDGARQAQVSWAELEIPNAARNAQVSWAELEIPIAARHAQVSWAEFEIPSIAANAQISWAEFEIPEPARHAQVSWAEFEIPTAARAAQISWAEFEIPTAARHAQVSWAEFEVPTAPRAAYVSWAELEIPEAARHAKVSWTELEVPDAARAAYVSWAEFEVPTAPRNAQVSWAELEVPNAARQAQVSWAEFEVPDPTTNRNAQVSWAEFEIPTAARNAQVSWAELEIPEAARNAQVSWAELEIPTAARAGYVSWAEFEIPTAPRAAWVSWAEFEVPDGARAAQLSWAEFEIPTAARSAQVSWTELELPNAARNAQISWTELEIPDAARAAHVSWAEFEIPDVSTGDRAAYVSWVVFQIGAEEQKSTIFWYGLGRW